MPLIIIVLASLILSGCFSSDAESTNLEPARQQWVESCTEWDDWDKSGPAFQIHANTYYVGTCGIGAILITGSEGHILIDGGTEQGARLITRNISSLGFDITDIKILLHSHEHFDHVAGLAELQRLSGAQLYASQAAKPVLETGDSSPSDPQHGMHDPFPAVPVDKTVDDGETVKLDNLSLKAIATPGHTQGALSWQWESCENGNCEWIVYADSLSPISGEAYRFSDHVPYLAAYKEGLEKLRVLDCTLLVTPHPSASQMRQRLAEGQLSNPDACIIYADAVRARLEKRLEKEASEN